MTQVQVLLGVRTGFACGTGDEVVVSGDKLVVSIYLLLICHKTL